MGESEDTAPLLLVPVREAENRGWIRGTKRIALFESLNPHLYLSLSMLPEFMHFPEPVVHYGSDLEFPLPSPLTQVPSFAVRSLFHRANPE